MLPEEWRGLGNLHLAGRANRASKVRQLPRAHGARLEVRELAAGSRPLGDIEQLVGVEVLHG